MTKYIWDMNHTASSQANWYRVNTNNFDYKHDSRIGENP